MMKKKLKLFLLLLISLSFGISKINADETYVLSDYSSSIDDDITFYNNHRVEIENVVEVWETNFSMEYPYYFLKINHTAFSNNYTISLTFSRSSLLSFVPGSDVTNFSLIPSDFNYLNNTIIYFSLAYDGVNSALCYKNHRSETTDNCPENVTVNGATLFLGVGTDFYPEEKTIPFINHGFKFSTSGSPYSILQFNSFTSSLYNFSYNTFYVEDNNIMPDVLSLYDETYTPEEMNTYEEIDLNSYDYVILSLKSYNTISEEYATNIYTLGSLCATTVYNYGMSEKKNYYSGFQTQACTEYYTAFTPVRFYILPQDVENHAVYYIKSSNTYVSNTIKVNTDIFDISYFTSSNSSNPSVVIGGRSYPVIPYDDLTDTAIISTNEGYISGRVCAIGDVDCYYDTQGIEFSDIFSHPLEVLQDVWSSISTIFVLITSFLALLPPQLQSFLFSAFMLAIVLGLLKIIIG